MTINNQINSQSFQDFLTTTATAGVDRASIVSNTDNTNIASHAHLQLTTGGAASGDPYINFLVAGAGIYSMGIDNTVAGDPFKICTSANPSAGSDLFTMTAAGVITLANDLDVTEGGTGVSTLTQFGVLIGQGVNDIQATAVGTTGQLLVARTGANPIFNNSAVGNFSFTSITPTINRTLTVSNTDNTDITSHAHLQLTTGGAGSGDPYINFSVVGANTISFGIDNSDSDTLKWTDGLTPSAGNTRLALATTGALTINNAYTLPTTDGVNGHTLQTNGAGVVSWQPNAPPGSVIQVQRMQAYPNTPSNAQIPYDNTIPQIVEGFEILTCNIIPTNVNNMLLIEFTGNFGILAGIDITYFIIALFQNPIANALTAVVKAALGDVNNDTMVLRYSMTAGTVANTQFSIRCGCNLLGKTFRVGPGINSLGGVVNILLTITEIKV